MAEPAAVSSVTPAADGESAIIVPVEVPIAIRRLRDRLDPTALDGVPAHLTLLYPFKAPAELDESVRETIGGIVAAEPTFPFALTHVGRWPDVVYLAPEPEAPFRRLIDALSAAFPEYPPYRGEHDDVVPHVTIASDPRPGYLAAAEHALPPMLPVRDVAREAWLIEHVPGRLWTTVWRFPFGPGRERAADR